MEKGCAGLGADHHGCEAQIGKALSQCGRQALVALTQAVTDLEQLKGHPAVARLVAWNPKAVEGVKFDRDEMTLYVERSAIREACALLRDDPACPFNYLSDITCVDWYPSEPRFHVVYHLFSIPKKERVRLKVKLNGDAPALESVTSVWPGANYFEREVFDLFGIRFTGHPYLRRLLMPEDWEGHPLRKDYPVEGYR
jgi:NADH-quinone oxidoreductase subunit C